VVDAAERPISIERAAFAAPRVGFSIGLSLAGLSKVEPGSAVVALIIATAIFRVGLAGAFGLGSDESYSVANSRFLDWSYVDYPPLHVWLTAAWVWLAHSDHPTIVRLPFIALFAGSTWLMYRLSARLFGARAGLWAALLLNLAPVYAVPHSSWVLPDGPLTFFMLACATVMANLLFEPLKPSRAVSGWLLAGLLAGLAMLSKYHGAFLIAGTFVFLLTWPPGRRHLASPGPWLAAAIAIALFAPVIVWNVQHGAAGLLFQSDRVTAGFHPSLSRLAANLMGQAAYLSPWLFAPLIVVWVRALRQGPRAPQSWYLALLASGPIVFFTAAAALVHSLPHWPMPGWLFVFPLLGAEAARWERKRPKLVLTAAAASAAIVAVTAAGIANEAANGWAARLMPASMARNDPTLDLLDWSEAATVIKERHLLADNTKAVAGTRWFEAGKLNYVIGRQAPVLCLCANPQEFRFLHNSAGYAGQDVLVIGASRGPRGEPLARWFDRIEPLAPIMLHRDGAAAMELSVFRGVGFRPGVTQPARRR
jgi:4-amino-4-deoxy-L-arabinose transferase-like glycosyltransferase